MCSDEGTIKIFKKTKTLSQRMILSSPLFAFKWKGVRKQSGGPETIYER